MKGKLEEKTLDVNEIFYSIDGEGITSGQLAVFIRLNGCNLRCRYCDTDYALKTQKNYISIKDIYNKVKDYKCANITITGGEPLVQENTLYLIEYLTKKGYRVNIETNGAIDIKSLSKIKNTIITLDIKTPDSKMDRYNNFNNFEYLRDTDVLKIVVGSLNDLDYAYKIVEKYNPDCQVFLSPIFGEIKGADIVEYMKNKKNDKIKFQLQIHKYIWDPLKKGV
jgi:7-carboxy-7-deazaguanine synthase